MFKKILKFLIVLLMLINVTSATDILVSTDSPISISFQDETPRVPQYTNPCTATYPYYVFQVNVDYGLPQYVSLIVQPTSWLGVTTINSRYDTNVTLKVGAQVVGNAIYGFTKNYDGTYTVQMWIDSWDTTGLSGVQIVSMYNYDFTTDVIVKHSPSPPVSSPEKIFFINFASTCGGGNDFLIGSYNIQWIKHWENTISYFDNTTYYYMELDRSTTYTSKALIQQENGIVLLNETAQSSTDISLINASLDFITWEYFLLDSDSIWHNGSFMFREAPTTAPFLITNKTNYLTSEDILISWGNMLNLPLAYTPATLELQIKYTEGTNEYLKWNEILDYHEYDGNRIISASYFIPQTNYTLYITDAEFPDIPLYHTTFNVKQSNNDYITTNKNYPPHQVYSGQTIQIYYQAQNISKLNIVDNDNNLVSSYTVSGIGTKNYNIPTDIEKSYSYPYWYVYLNDTVTSISLNQSIKAVWVSEPQITPTIPPTVQKTPDITSNDTTEILTELKNGTKPLIDLVYGIGFIFVDNPDYDDNSVVSIDEMNQWFNSLVKVGIFILLITFYYGFKREEQLRK